MPSNPVVPVNAIITNPNDPYPLLPADNSGINEDPPRIHPQQMCNSASPLFIEVGPRRPLQPAPQRQFLFPQPTSFITVTRTSMHGRSHSHSRTSNREQLLSQQPTGTNLAVQQQPPRRPSSAGATSLSGANLLAYTSQFCRICATSTS